MGSKPETNLNKAPTQSPSIILVIAPKAPYKIPSHMENFVTNLNAPPRMKFQPAPNLEREEIQRDTIGKFVEKKILLILSNKKIKKLMCSNARRHVLKSFSYPVVAKQYSDLYSKVIRNKDE